jgi:hypothetical protein
MSYCDDFGGSWWGGAVAHVKEHVQAQFCRFLEKFGKESMFRAEAIHV